jgi:hypothetical protein
VVRWPHSAPGDARLTQLIWGLFLLGVFARSVLHAPNSGESDKEMGISACAPRIGVVGSNMIDLVTYVDRMPVLDETDVAPSFAPR